MIIALLKWGRYARDPHQTKRRLDRFQENCRNVLLKLADAYVQWKYGKEPSGPYGSTSKPRLRQNLLPHPRILTRN